MGKTKTPIFKKADIILAAALLALGLLSLLLLQKSAGAFVSVTIDGELYGRYSLAEDRVVEINSPNGHNTMEIKDGQVRVTHADCPGGDCMEFGAVSAEGQVILCLPHHLSIKIGGGGTQPDAIAY